MRQAVLVPHMVRTRMIYFSCVPCANFRKIPWPTRPTTGRTTMRNNSERPSSTGYLWIFLNLVLITVGLRGGYASLSPDRLRHTNPDPIFCLIILVGTTLFPILAVAYSIHRWKSDLLPRPSWSGNPLNWWRNPLQGLFISTCVLVAMAVGAALRRPSFGSAGSWTLATYACFAVGLSLGQFSVYRIYRQRIAPS